MNFHPNLNVRKKKTNRNKIVVGIFIFAIAFLFSQPVIRVAKDAIHVVAAAGMGIAVQAQDTLSAQTSFPQSKSAMQQRIIELEQELNEARIALFETQAALVENRELRMVAGGTPETSPRILAGILAKPNRSVYGTMLIDAGREDGVSVGDAVYVLGSMRIGNIASVERVNSTVRLFSAPGRTLYVTTADGIELQATGRGNGNFFLEVPRDVEMSDGTDLLLPGSENIIIAQVKKIVFDPRNPTKQVFASSPVNINEVRFVQVAQPVEFLE